MAASLFGPSGNSMIVTGPDPVTIINTQGFAGHVRPVHEQAAGGDPTSGDANADQSPLAAKGDDEGREEGNDNEDRDSESQKNVRATVETIDARSVQVSVEAAKKSGQYCDEW